MSLSLTALPGRIITLQNHKTVRDNADNDGYAEVGMKARVVSTRIDDEHAVLRLNLAEFAAHNQTCESADYKVGNSHLTATEAGKAESVEDIYIAVSELENAIKVEDGDNPILVAYLARDDQSQSYTAFLEELVERAIAEHGFDVAGPKAEGADPK